MANLFDNYYDALMKPLEKWALGSIRRELLTQAKGNVLEIGSGTGLNFQYYRHADKVFAIEPVKSMRDQSLLRANQAAVPIEVLDADAQSLPFQSNEFDTVVATLVLCTIPDPVAALAEIHRVCKPGGSVLLIEHVHMKHSVWGTLQNWLTPGWKRLCGGCHLNRDTLGLVEQEGLRITQLQWRYNKLVFIAVAIKSE